MVLFQVPQVIDTPSHDKAFEALSDNGSILDIGWWRHVTFAMGKRLDARLASIIKVKADVSANANARGLDHRCTKAFGQP